MSETLALTQGLPSHIRPGFVIGAKYRLEEEIGRGSMGTVYRAVHITLGQRVAIKLISGEHSQSLEARQRFSLEAKAAAKLRSRHVVQVYDDGETPEGNPYIVLEYLEGETLEQRLERDHDLALEEAVRISCHVGRALARAHAQGIVHRDLKPANIFLVKTDDEEEGFIAKVLDFGIAKQTGQVENGTTQAGTVLGTPLFMSPEQVRGASSVDHRADLYSLGICLYQMLTGELAYYSANYSDTLIAICTKPLPRLRDKAPWLPESVEQWFQRACAKEPLARFQSADEMMEALQAVAGGVALSKHQSFPEGRIAPETLVGYAMPALSTLHSDSARVSLTGTQVLPAPFSASPGADTSPGFASPGFASPGFASPSYTAVASAAEHAAHDGSAWNTADRGLKPLLIGVGVGLLAVAALAIAFTSLGASDERKARAAPSAPVPMTASATALTSRLSGTARSALTAVAPALEPRPAPAPVLSSAAAGAPAELRPKQRSSEPIRKPGGARKAAAEAAVKATPAKPPGSDLGF